MIWECVPLSEIVASLTSGTSLICDKGTPSNDEPAILKLSCLSEGLFNPLERKKAPRSAWRQLKISARKDSILISRSNTPALVGSCAYVEENYPLLYLPDTIWRFETNNNIASNQKWLSLLLGSKSYQNRIARIAAGTSNSMKKLQKTALLKLKISLPPLPEQQKIAEVLSTWDDALNNLDTLIQAKQQRKKALMQQLLTGKKRLPGFDQSNNKRLTDKFGCYPEDWNCVCLGEITQVSNTKNTDRVDLPVLSCTKHHGLVRSKEYFGKKVYADDTSGYRVVKRHQFAYATNHIEEGSIGYQNICDTGLVSPIYTVFKICNDVDDGYLFRVLKSPLLIHLYQVNTNASVNRRGSLRYNSFAKIKIWLPSKEEQTAIANILTTCDKEITLLQEQRKSLEKQKRGLMQQLLTGKIRTSA